MKEPEGRKKEDTEDTGGLSIGRVKDGFCESRRFREMGRFKMSFERKQSEFGNHHMWRIEGKRESEMSSGLWLYDFQEGGSLEKQGVRQEPEAEY